MNELNFEIKRRFTSLDVYLPDLSVELLISLDPVKDPECSQLCNVSCFADYNNNPIRFSFIYEINLYTDIAVRCSKMFSELIKYL